MAWLIATIVIVAVSHPVRLQRVTMMACARLGKIVRTALMIVPGKRAASQNSAFAVVMVIHRALKAMGVCVMGIIKLPLKWSPRVL
jgi:hypothetical protein